VSPPAGKRRGGLLLFLFFCCLPFPLFSGGKKAPPEPPVLSDGSLYEQAAEGQILTVTGTVRLVGNEPFTELVVTDGAGNNWYVAEEGRSLLAPWQHRPVTVRGKVRMREMVLANGKALGTRRIIMAPELLTK
jgi:hypothetical protein